MRTGPPLAEGLIPRTPVFPGGVRAQLLRRVTNWRDRLRYPGLMPQFLGIGAQKGGTTWLHNCLARHPDCFLPEEKEVHYFDWQVDTHPLGHYLRKMREGRGKLIGEVNPSYGPMNPVIIDYVRGLNPAMKMILIMRNPIERAWSHAIMDLVSYGGREYEEVTDDDLRGHFHRKFVPQYGDYAMMLENWRTRFSPGQVKAYFFEDIRTRPRELLGEVFDFLGLRHDVNWDDIPHSQVIHEGRSIPLPDHLREELREIYRPMIERLAQEFGPRALAWLEPKKKG